MANVAAPIIITVIRKAPLRPALSPMRPNTSAPSGRNRKPAPNRASAAARPAVGGRPAKKVLEMTPVRLPKTKKSYHSKAVPADEAAMTVRSGVSAGFRSSTVAAISAIYGSLPQGLEDLDLSRFWRAGKAWDCRTRRAGRGSAGLGFSVAGDGRQGVDVGGEGGDVVGRQLRGRGDDVAHAVGLVEALVRAAGQ